MTVNLSASALVPTEVADPINSRILAVSEDRIAGFVEEPFANIAAATDLPEEVVVERLRAMLSAGVIRRIRQTLMATNLAPGALVAAIYDEVRRFSPEEQRDDMTVIVARCKNC